MTSEHKPDDAPSSEQPPSPDQKPAAPSSELPPDAATAPPSRFDPSRLRSDILGGITAGIVALPLALGFGVASGLEGGAVAGLYGAIAIGIVAALFGGTPTQVSGPTGPMTVVAAGFITTIVAAGADPKLIFLATALAGALQIGMGALKLGRLVQFVPYPVVSGFMTGIGVIIICLQFPVLFGADPVTNPLAALKGLPEFLPKADFTALLLGLGTIALVYLTPRVTKAVPGTLVALVLASGASTLLALNVETISAIPRGLPKVVIPELGWEVFELVLPAAIVLAVLGSVDSLLTSLVADRITNTRHDSDRELFGQGLGNIAAGLIGGLPGAGATMRTVVNVQSGGRGRVSGVTHGLLLLAILLGLAPLAERIPLPVLAGILVTVGIGILDYRGLKDIARVPRGDAGVMILVLVLTVVVDLMWAVGAGVVASCVLVVKRLADRLPAVPAEEEQAVSDEGVTPEGVRVLRAREALFFGNAENLRRTLADVEEHTLVLCLGDVHLLDQSGAYTLADTLDELRKRGVRLYVSDVDEDVQTVLGRLGVAPGLVPDAHMFETRDEAIAAATKEAPAAEGSERLAAAEA